VEVLAAVDGTRITLVTRWRGDDRRRLLREGAIVRAALADQPALALATPMEAHLYHIRPAAAAVERRSA